MITQVKIGSDAAELIGLDQQALVEPLISVGGEVRLRTDSTLKVDSSYLKVNVGTGLTTESGAVEVKLGTGLYVATDGSITAASTSLPSFGSGLKNDGYQIFADLGSGLEFSGKQIVPQIPQAGGLTVLDSGICLDENFAPSVLTSGGDHSVGSNGKALIVKTADATIKKDSNGIRVNVNTSNAIGTDAGGIKVLMDKTTIGTNANGELSVNFGDGLTIEDGKLMPKIGSGLTFEDGVLKPKLGSGLKIDIEHNAIRPDFGKGLTVDATSKQLEARLGSGLKFDGTKISLDTADGIKFNDGGAAVVDYEVVATTLAANSAAIKTVEVGTGVKGLDLDMGAVSQELIKNSKYLKTNGEGIELNSVALEAPSGGIGADADGRLVLTADYVDNIIDDTATNKMTDRRFLYKVYDDNTHKVYPLVDFNVQEYKDFIEEGSYNTIVGDVDGHMYVNTEEVNSRLINNSSDVFCANPNNGNTGLGLRINEWDYPNILSLATGGLIAGYNTNHFNKETIDAVPSLSLKLKTNGGLQTDANGLSVNLGSVFDTTSGSIGLNLGSGLTWETTGNNQAQIRVSVGSGLLADSGSLVPLLGTGLSIDMSGKIGVVHGNGITTNSGAVSVVPNTSKGIEVTSSGVGIRLSDTCGLDFDSAGILMVRTNKNFSTARLPNGDIAVNVEDNGGIERNADTGALQLAAATTEALGGVKKASLMLATGANDAAVPYIVLSNLLTSLQNAGIVGAVTWEPAIV